MKPLIILLLLTGCANKYEFTKCVGKNKCTTVSIKSYTEYPEGYSARFNVETNEFTMLTGQAIKQEVPVKDIVNGAKTLLKLFPLK